MVLDEFEGIGLGLPAQQPDFLGFAAHHRREGGLKQDTVGVGLGHLS